MMWQCKTLCVIRLVKTYWTPCAQCRAVQVARCSTPVGHICRDSAPRLDSCSTCTVICTSPRRRGFTQLLGEGEGREQMWKGGRNKRIRWRKKQKKTQEMRKRGSSRKKGELERKQLERLVEEWDLSPTPPPFLPAPPPPHPSHTSPQPIHPGPTHPSSKIPSLQSTGKTWKSADHFSHSQLQIYV